MGELSWSRDQWQGELAGGLTAPGLTGIIGPADVERPSEELEVSMQLSDARRAQNDVSTQG
jgi:hypothetical protein